jgi:3-phosphoshikimate 1-carboxyvinyltransferase
MPLPDLIEIVPLDKPVRAEITVPGSKSITNRALVLAALAEGETTLQGALWSEDTQVMVECLQDLGFMVNVAPDPDETCNRTITVYGLAGKVPRGGTKEQPLELFVGNAGTAARFLAAMVCLGEGVYRLHGVPRMHERPQAALFQALRELGYRIDSVNDRLPVLVHGAGARPAAKCSVSIEESSQFASALMLGGKVGGWTIRVTGENAEESPYVAMTSDLLKVFPRNGGSFQIEPDASSASYFCAVSQIDPVREFVVPEGKSEAQKYMQPAEWKKAEHPPFGEWPYIVFCDPAEQHWEVIERGCIEIPRWPKSGWQIDANYPHYMVPDPVISRERDLGDSIMTAIVMAPVATGTTGGKYTDLGRLRVQECERVVALRTELTKCGAKVIETGDTLEVFPSQLHGATIETYNDHRMAMCFAILGLKIPGIKIKNPACVKKTFPNFFQKLAAPPPRGLGAKILDASGCPLAHDELFAE